MDGIGHSWPPPLAVNDAGGGERTTHMECIATVDALAGIQRVPCATTTLLLDQPAHQFPRYDLNPQPRRLASIRSQVGKAGTNLCASLKDHFCAADHSTNDQPILV